MGQKTYTIDELVKLTGYSRRTIRYYVAEGLMDPPAGRGRGGYYYDSHLQRLRQIRSLRNKGLGISEIQKLTPEAQAAAEPAPARESWVRFSVFPGVEIHVRDDLEGKNRKAVETLVRIGRSLFEEQGEAK